jgi:hypothetical protein
MSAPPLPLLLEVRLPVRLPAKAAQDLVIAVLLVQPGAGPAVAGLVSLISPGNPGSLVSPGHLSGLVSPGHLLSLVSPGRLSGVVGPGSLVSPGRRISPATAAGSRSARRTASWP